MSDEGKMEHWTLRWPGVLFRAFAVPVIGGSLMFAFVAFVLWWLG